MLQTINFRPRFLLLVSLLALMACDNQEETPVPAPMPEEAAFAFAVDPDNPNKVTFTALAEPEAWYTHWAFGDNTAAEGMEAVKTYPLAGEYVVRFKIFTEGGTAETRQTVSIASDLTGPNLVQNGSFEGNEFWTDLPISPGVNVAFENEAATWSGGGWGHAGIYQAIEVEAAQAYQIDMQIKGGGLSDAWFEVYAGTTVPTSGVDYTDGGIRLGLNTWEGCGGEPFEGLFTTLSCSGGDGTFSFPTAGTVYLVIRGGGGDYGAEGVTIDNVVVRPL